jgi:hypothetical protein
VLANNNPFAEYSVIMPSKHVCPIFQPQTCTLTDPNTGVENEYLIGHGSNDPWFLHAEYAPVKVAGTYICLVDTSTTEFPACYCSRPGFTAADITCTNTVNLQDGVKYMVVDLPLVHPIPYSINDTAKGTVSKSSLDILDTTIQDGAF